MSFLFFLALLVLAFLFALRLCAGLLVEIETHQSQ